MVPDNVFSLLCDQQPVTIMMMQKGKGFLSFLAGLLLGALFGMFVDEKDKKRMQGILYRTLIRLPKAYGRSVRERVEWAKRFVKTNLS